MSETKQAVTDEMVEAALSAWYGGPWPSSDQLEVEAMKMDMRAALQAALATPIPAQQAEGAILEVEWQKLLDKDDRTSPAEYPDMVLITREELRDAMLAASPLSGGKLP